MLVFYFFSRLSWLAKLSWQLYYYYFTLHGSGGGTTSVRRPPFWFGPPREIFMSYKTCFIKYINSSVSTHESTILFTFCVALCCHLDTRIGAHVHDVHRSYVAWFAFSRSYIVLTWVAASSLSIRKRLQWRRNHILGSREIYISSMLWWPWMLLYLVSMKSLWGGVCIF